MTLTPSTDVLAPPAVLGGRGGRCPDCGGDVLVTPDGRRLEPDPHPLALHLPGGGTLSWRAAVAAATGTGPVLGHHAHSTVPGYGCEPAALQLPLWT